MRALAQRVLSGAGQDILERYGFNAVLETK